MHILIKHVYTNVVVKNIICGHKYCLKNTVINIILPVFSIVPHGKSIHICLINCLYYIFKKKKKSFHFRQMWKQKHAFCMLHVWSTDNAKDKQTWCLRVYKQWINSSIHTETTHEYQ